MPKDDTPAGTFTSASLNAASAAAGKKIAGKEKEAEAPAAPKPESVVDAKKSGKHILIIEDEKPLAHALALKMQHDGFATNVALNGADGLKEALTGKYAIILLDLIMPEVDGFAILQAMQEKKIKTPIMVLSNLGQDEDRQRTKKFGVNEYFVKANTPIADILKKVKEII